MKRLVFRLRNALDHERIDVVEVIEGVTLRDVDDGKTRRPFIAIGALVAVELLDDEPGATVTPTPDPLPEIHGTPVPSAATSVPTDVEPGTPARWGALPLNEEPLDAA